MSRRRDFQPPGLSCTGCGRTITRIVYFIHPQPVRPLCERCYRAHQRGEWEAERAFYLKMVKRDIGAFDEDAPRNGLPVPRPCETCGREVAFGVWRRSRKTFCSRECAREVHNRPRRIKPEPRVCKREGCSEVFIPTRSDALYHSGACKQRDYRGRLRPRGHW